MGKIGTLEERITSLKKREAEAGKKDRERQNSKRRTKKLNRKSELNEAKNTTQMAYYINSKKNSPSVSNY